ncbi:MAG TPA: tail fiber domain-containing protein [Paludibacter sp.]|nr:tail fiber domain-containing protein [Paludibacter sp.]
MKTKLVVISISLSISLLLSAQLKVSADGNVGLQLGTATPLSALSVGGVGGASAKGYILGENCQTGLSVSRTGTSANNQQYSIFGSSAVVSTKSSYGIGGYSYLPTLLGSGRSWGVVGYAGNSTSGYNYGVMGTHFGTGNGAGIVGTVNGNQDVNVPGIYAGYFVGNVYVTGTLTGNPVVNSDKRYKKNIVGLNTASTLSSVLQMQPVEYNLAQVYMKSKGDSAVVERPVYDENSQVFQKKHYGLIAQDLQQLYPDLVYSDDNGYLSVNYVGIIPLLIESIKELKGEIEALSAGPKKAGAQAASSPDGVDALSYPMLEQNVPNPFNQSTTIGFYLPATVSTASVYVYDMNGTQLKSYPVSGIGKGSVEIQGAEFNAGMYLYALIADGKVIDTKRMILTK